MQSSSFFRLQAPLHLCRLLLHPFITLFSTESASHFYCIAPFYSSLHLSFCLHPPIMHLSILVCLSLILFPVVSCHTSSFSDTPDIASFLFPTCLHRSFHLSESLSTSIPLYLLLHSCPCEIIYSSSSFFPLSCISSHVPLSVTSCLHLSRPSLIHYFLTVTFRSSTCIPTFFFCFIVSHIFNNTSICTRVVE